MIECVPVDLLTTLAAESPAPEVVSYPTRSHTANAGDGQYTSRLLVEQWLTDQGVEHRRKAEPDGRGRTVYVLAVCPFDPSHGDPQPCIMQDPSGKMSAQCFHSSCRGRGWQEFKQKIGRPKRHHYDPPLPERSPRRRRQPRQPSSPQTGRANGQTTETYDTDQEDHAGDSLLSIQGNKRQLRDVTSDALAALLAHNDPPTVYQRGGVLTRLRIREDDGAPLLEPLVNAALRGVLARVADWKNIKDTKGGEIEEDDAPPMEVVKDLANLPGWDGIPVIEAVVESPVFARTGELIDAPGFHRQARLWYHSAAGLVVPSIPRHPTATEIKTARQILLEELLGDFPFVNDASRCMPWLCYSCRLSAS